MLLKKNRLTVDFFVNMRSDPQAVSSSIGGWSAPTVPGLGGRAGWGKAQKQGNTGGSSSSSTGKKNTEVRAALL